LIIAHRLSTVLIADRVLVLADGAVVEDGPPAQLITASGPFASLHATFTRSLHPDCRARRGPGGRGAGLAR
jgi:ATP-binding cassette, subfamily B, bacterial